MVEPLCRVGAGDTVEEASLTVAHKRILLIDADQPSLQNWRAGLETAGYEILVAAEGHQGLALARTESPDLIVLDWLLPGLDGFQICRSLKEDPRYAHIPIVMATDMLISQEDVQRGLQMGAERYVLRADAYVEKRPACDQLLHTVRLLLNEAAPQSAPEKDLILVVDGDGPSCALLEQTLSEEGYSVLKATDGQQGWVQFQSSEPSLVLMDVQVPGSNGLQVLRQIRERTADVAVIVMAASGSEEIALRALEQGADDYLLKPFQSWQIMPVVTKNLEKARLRCLNRQLLARLRDSNAHLLEKHRALENQNAELQDAYQRFHDAEQMRGNLVGMIAHDLKNPLNVMLLSLDLLAMDFGAVLDEEQRAILRSANLAGQQMYQLITDLLEVQRLEEGKMPVRPQCVNLPLTLRVTVHQAQPLADQKDLALLLQVPDTLPPVLADLDLTPRVVANLLDNAIKFAPLGGRISVSADVAEKEVIVCVADSGPGIPAEQQTHIFGKFAQVDQGPRRTRASVGLGLAFCKLAVEAQGGRIWVESELGQGSQFKFSLPLAGVY